MCLNSCTVNIPHTCVKASSRVTLGCCVVSHTVCLCQTLSSVPLYLRAKGAERNSLLLLLLKKNRDEALSVHSKFLAVQRERHGVFLCFFSLLFLISYGNKSFPRTVASSFGTVQLFFSPEHWDNCWAPPKLHAGPEPHPQKDFLNHRRTL